MKVEELLTFLHEKELKDEEIKELLKATLDTFDEEETEEDEKAKAGKLLGVTF